MSGRTQRWGASGMVLTVTGMLAVSLSTAQPPQQQKCLHFEVATLKPANPKSDVGSSTNFGGSGGQLRMLNTPLKQLVEMGLSVEDYALKSPSWLDTSRFDLEARLPAGKPVDEGMIDEMVRSLLIERFGLKWHADVQTVPGFELVVGKKVLAKPATQMERVKGVHGSSSGPAFISGINMSTSELAVALGKVLGRPVIDGTHLSDGFDIRLRWLPDNEAAVTQERQYAKQYGIDVDNLPSSVFTAVEEQLGLKLQSAKIPSRVITVDNINRQPTQN